jgi:hypothetical protein
MSTEFIVWGMFMKFYKNKKILPFVSITALIIITTIGTYWYFHPTHYKYNDRFIIGKSISQIVKRYGEFDRVFYTDLSETVIHSGLYLVKPTVVGFMGTSWPEYYTIIFEDGKAIKVLIEIGGWGG